MTFASICSGIGGFDLAFERAGFKCLWKCEIDRQCREVLKHHWPEGIIYENMLNIPDDAARPDVLCGGTPCQSFSVAGLRKGLDDPRGNLALGFLALARRLAPTWIVLENVPGLLSIDEGRAFGSFLGGLAVIGYGFAYRVLDAQYFGLAQRRKRVFVVGHSGGIWQRPAALLFDSASVRGASAPSREKGQGVAGSFTARPSAALRLVLQQVADSAPTSSAKGGLTPETSPTLLGGANKTGGDRPPGSTVDNCDSLIPEICDRLQERDSKGSDSNTKTGHLLPVGMAVRRLTPTECERLQGFPDGWTKFAVSEKTGKVYEQKDRPRYRQIDNAVAVPVVKWIADCIRLIEELRPVGQTCQMVSRTNSGT